MVDFSFIVSLYVSDLPNVTISSTSTVLYRRGVSYVRYTYRTGTSRYPALVLLPPGLASPGATSTVRYGTVLVAAWRCLLKHSHYRTGTV